MFKEILREIVVGSRDAVGAVLMGFDGIGIDHYSVDDNGFDLNLVGIEYSNVVKEIRNAADILNFGELEEVSVKTADHYVIIRSITNDYFAALLVSRGGNYGQGRYLLMRDAPKLRLALA